MQLTSQVKDYNTIKQKFSCKKSSQLSLQTCQKFLQDSAGFDAFNSQAKDCMFYFFVDDLLSEIDNSWMIV